MPKPILSAVDPVANTGDAQAARDQQGVRPRFM